MKEHLQIWDAIKRGEREDMDVIDDRVYLTDKYVFKQAEGRIDSDSLKKTEEVINRIHDDVNVPKVYHCSEDVLILERIGEDRMGLTES